MENDLKKCITELNNIHRIKENEHANWIVLMFLPLLQSLKIDTSKLKENIEIPENSKIEIKKLKFYRVDDFLKVSDKIEYYLSEFTDEIHEILPENGDIQGIDFLLYEILLNIYKHSKFENAYIQFIIHTDNKMDICIMDDGIGIPGSFKESSINFENDCESIYGAINGKTTDKEKYNLHGRGLNSSARIITLGFEGEMLIASGNGICLINQNGAKTYLNKNKIKGTFIIIRINNKKVENIYDYLKHEKINRITEVKHD